MTAISNAEVVEQELPAEMVSAWATVLLDIHERDQRESAKQRVPPNEARNENASSCPIDGAIATVLYRPENCGTVPTVEGCAWFPLQT